VLTCEAKNPSVEMNLNGDALHALGWFSCLTVKKCDAQASSVCINGLLTKLEVKIAEYLPIFFCVFYGPRRSRDSMKEQKIVAGLACLGSQSEHRISFHSVPPRGYSHMISIFYFNLSPRSVKVSDVG